MELFIKLCLCHCFFICSVSTKPQYGDGIPDVLEGLPYQTFYQPEKSPKVPVLIGERRCDNYYNGQIMPCLERPWLPAFSYSTTEYDNGEYRKKRDIVRASRAARGSKTFRKMKLA